MRAPPQFSGLRPLADKTIDRPSIDELVGLLRHMGNLRVAFSDMNDLDAQRLRQRSPAGPVFWNGGFFVRVLCDIQERLLCQMRNQAGICATREDSRPRPLLALPPLPPLPPH